MDRFRGKTVIVTGAAGGIGRGAVERFSAEGANVVAVDRPGANFAGIEKAVGTELVLVEADVTIEGDVARYVDQARNRFGKIDALFNNAGIEGPIGSLTRVSVDDFDRVMAVNVRGVFLGLKHVAPAMTGGGAIVNTSSVAGLTASASMSPYGASKWAVISLTKSAAIEFAPMKIRVNAICPGPIETPMMRSIEAARSPDDPQKAYDRMAGGNPSKRYGTPAEIAGLVAYLCSDEASYITGGVHAIDGGMGI